MTKKAAKAPPAAEEKRPAPPAAHQPAWTVTFCILAALLLLLTWFPLSKIFTHFDGGSNEGFSSYYQQVAADGKGLYSQPPLYYYVNYPPFSFHLVAWLSKIAGAGVNPTGRWLSLAALAGIAVLIGLIVERLGGARRYAIYAGLCWIIWTAAFDTARIGFNDPHLLGILFNLAAFYLFVRDPESTRSLILCGVLFSLSFFTKQTLFVFPAAIAVELFLASQKRFLTWLAAGVGSSILFLILTFAVDGRYFLSHLMLPRQYSVTDMWSNTVLYLTFVQAAFAAALLWILWQPRTGLQRLMVWVFAIGYPFGVYLVGGNGAGVNHFYDALIGTIIICGLVLSHFEHAAAATPYPRAVLAVLLIVPFFLSSILVLPKRIPYDSARSQSVAGFEKEYATVTALVRAQPGPALCESMLVCFEAGKQEIFDVFAVDQAIKTGNLDERNVLQLIAGRHFGAVVINFNPAETIRPAGRQRFSDAFMKQLFDAYRLAYRDTRYGVFIPKPS